MSPYPIPAAALEAPTTPYVGLAPFLRKSIVGDDLQPIAQALLAEAQHYPDAPDSWMNLAIAMHSIGNRDLALTIQAQALAMKTTYSLPARQQPACCRLLMLMVPGDLAANTPLECLLETADVDIVQHFILPASPSLDDLPEHDLLFVAISEADEHVAVLEWLEQALTDWPKPVLNRPAGIPPLARDQVSETLAHIDGLLIPPTHRVPRALLEAVASGVMALGDVAPGARFPVILRPVGSQAGRDLAKLATPAAIADYLGQVSEPLLYLANFIDYSGEDGLFRKARVVLVDGQPFVAHMAVSQDWMVHYVNAGMYENAERREEEARFMADFAAFAERHRAALSAIHARCGLDLLCIDCAETRDGDFLVFEVGNAMVVHAMDPVAQFPYKPPVIARIVDAFRKLLLRRLGAQV